MRSSLIARLRERGVLRVAGSYAVIAWLVLQIADVVLEPWDAPGWVRRAPLVVALLGFPITTELLETMRSHGVRNSGVRLATAKVCALAGRTDEAIEQLGLAIDTPDWPEQTAASTESDPALAGLSRDPRFKSQVKRLREREARARSRLTETFRRQGLDWPPQ